MAAFFLHPGFLIIAAALVSVPIIIHLINRMRFKRIRWAAMEFLLKAQKRTRRRLIIEQLLLLALRCLLVALVGLLVARFVGCSDANLSGKPDLHLVLLDDTLSTQDVTKQKDRNDKTKTCFDVAKEDAMIKQIGKAVEKLKGEDELMILPLSKADDKNYKPKKYNHLNDSTQFAKLESDIRAMQPSMLHVDMLTGIKRAEDLINSNAEGGATLYIVTDVRDTDFSSASGKNVGEKLRAMVKDKKDRRIRVIDTADPPRTGTNADSPQENNNIGIVDFRPSTRIVGKKAEVKFTITIRNFSKKPVECALLVRDEGSGGGDLADGDFTARL